MAKVTKDSTPGGQTRIGFIKPYQNVFLENGYGHVEAINMFSGNYNEDGDEFTYLDNSNTPQIHGSGTEDEFNQSWAGGLFRQPLWGSLKSGVKGSYRIQLWSNEKGVNSFGAGKIYSGQTVAEVLKIINVSPDFEYNKTKRNSDFLFVHRKLPKADIYWVNNRNSWNKNLEAIFRVKGKVAEIRDPVTGKIEKASYVIKGERNTETIYRKDSPLLPSGLLGPVRILSVNNNEYSEKNKRYKEQLFRHLPIREVNMGIQGASGGSDILVSRNILFL